MLNLLESCNFYYKLSLASDEVDILEDLEKYINKDYYIHLSNYDNVFGLYIKSHYKTPIGIYTYPLDHQIYNELKTFNLPYAAESKYVYLLKNKGKVLKLGNYTESNMKEDINKLISKGLKKERIFDILENKDEARINTTGGIFFYLTYKLANNNIYIWNKIFDTLDYSCVEDNKGEGIIHENEPTQAFFIGAK
jgi:Na+-transporting NADH:ubiquinone oxidoreductase subunit NqrF